MAPPEIASDFQAPLTSYVEAATWSRRVYEPVRTEHYPNKRNLFVFLPSHETEKRTVRSKRSERINIQMRRGCRPPAPATLVSSTRALGGLDFILQPPVRFPIEPHNVKPSATIRQRNKPRRRFLEADRTRAEGATVHKIEVRVPTEQRRIIISRHRPEAPEGPDRAEEFW